MSEPVCWTDFKLKTRNSKGVGCGDRSTQGQRVIPSSTRAGGIGGGGGVLFVFRIGVIVYIFNPPTAQQASKQPMLSRVLYSFRMLYIQIGSAYRV
jgi:hypothetical protein